MKTVIYVKKVLKFAINANKAIQMMEKIVLAAVYIVPNVVHMVFVDNVKNFIFYMQ